MSVHVSTIKCVLNCIHGLAFFSKFVLFSELHLVISTSPTLYCDNQNAQCLAQNLIQHVRTKYIELDQHFIRDQVLQNQLLLKHVFQAIKWLVL